jgi:hypothetical protein
VVPESIPRPAAKVIVGFVGFSVVALVLKSILSTALTLLVVVGGGYLYLTRGGGGGGDDGGGGGGGGGGGSRGSGGSGSDALDDARRIMDKYKR